MRACTFISLLLLFLPRLVHAQTTQDGDLRMEVIAAPNFVVDSNIETPAGYGPSAAHLGVKICNDGATALTDVYVNIGDLTDALNCTGTPGVYPSRTVTVSGQYTGTFSLTHEGGAADATRYIPRIEPGECITVYYLVSYPTLDGNGDSVTGSAPDPNDDLWLNYAFWASAYDGATTRKVCAEQTATMRNEISAMANKIWPNTDSKVPDEYLDAIEAELGWRPETGAGSTESSVLLEGIWFDLGNINQGFDNNGDGVPDYNAWMQPVGDPELYDASCFRLVKTYGIVIVKLNDGSELLIPFEDQMYFENLPPNNTGAVGLTFYEFLPLSSGCSAALTPYQEVASGSDNEKFNADFGTIAGEAVATEPDIDFDKSGPVSTPTGAGVVFELSTTNNSSSGVGFPAGGTGIVFEDSIPANLEYVAGSAGDAVVGAENTLPSGVGVTIRYSTDNGATWSTTEPATASDVTDIQWWLEATLPAGATATMRFKANVPVGYAATTIENCAEVSFGGGDPLKEDCSSTLIQGINSVSGTVFEDDGTTPAANFANGVYDSADPGEVGIATVEIKLYIDLDNNISTTGDRVLLSTTTSAASTGDYSFTNLPDGTYIVEVDPLDSNVPASFGITTPREIAVDLDSAEADSNAVTSADNDFGFAPPLTIDKVEPTLPVFEGQELTYPIEVTNNLQAPPSGGGGPGEALALYWTEDTDATTTTSDLDGGGVTNVAKLDARWLALDEVNRLVYHSDGTTITSTNLDGSNPTVAFTNTNPSVGQMAYIEVDPDNGHIYFSDSPNFAIHRTDLDGSNLQTIISGLATSPRGIDLDLGAGKLYYVLDDGPVHRANLDGTGSELLGDVSASVNDAMDLEVDPGGGLVYVARFWGRAVTSLDIATGTATDVYALSEAGIGLAIDPAGGDLWVSEASLILKGSMDGTASLVQIYDSGGQVLEDLDVLTTGGGGGGGFDAATTLSEVALRDQYDPAELEFVSASVSPSSVNTITGEIIWNNIGPIDAGETVNINVTFRALRQVGNGPYQWLDNDADITNAVFASGQTANLPSDTTEVEMSPTGTVAGRVWADANNNGWQPGTTPNNNGYEAGESGVPGVTVTLNICDQAPPTNGPNAGTCTGNLITVVATTDSNGDYFFDGLEPNLWYSVVVDPATIPGAPNQTGDPDDDGINNGNANTCGNGGANSPCTDSWDNGDAWLQLAVGGWADAAGTAQQWEITNVNFGYSGVTPTIFGYVWHDLNGDGVWDSNEPPLSGVTVNATGPSVANAITDAAGFYYIDQDTGAAALNVGAYVLTVNGLPVGVTWTNTFESATNSATPAIPNGDPAYNNGITFALAGATEQSGNWNFGFSCVGTFDLGDTLFVDLDGDGTQNTGEGGLEGVDVALWLDNDGDGVATPGVDYLMGTDTTDASGNYLFSTLPPGDFLVLIDESDIPLTWTQTADPDGGNDGESAVTLAATDLDQDFGYQPVGSNAIGDTVFLDDNGDQAQGGGEAGIANVTVTLYADLDGNGSFETQLGVTTSSDGSNDPAGTYLFQNLPDGDYQVVVDTADTDIPSDRTASTATSYDVTLAGADYLDADFGFAPKATIGDFVFYDANNNGTQDISEEGIPSVTLQLWIDTDNDGVADTNTGITTITNAVAPVNPEDPPIGSYQFSDVAELPVGQSYVVKVDTTTLPPGLVQTSDPDRDGIACDDNTYPSMPACDDADAGILAPPGGAYSGADFGYLPPGVIGDYVWLDTNGDGVQDAGEPGIAGVTVQVTDGTNTYTIETDADGYYSFANLSDATWTVSLPASNFSSGEPLEGLAASFDSDGGTDNSTDVVISSGQVDSGGNAWCSTADCSLDVDFGLKFNGAYSLEGTVCINDSRTAGTCDDIDNFTDDGVDQDAGATDETELGGVTVYLYKSEDSGTTWDPIGSTVTDASGDYSFSNLPDGDYRVIIGTGVAPLDDAVLTTTSGNNADVDDVEVFDGGTWTDSTGSLETGTSVAQYLSISGADVVDVDYAFTSTKTYDWGDLPASYDSTTLAQDGARHEIPSGGATVYLGATAPDADINGMPTSFADGDDTIDASDDEDGVVPVDIGNWADGLVGDGDGGAVSVTVAGSGWLVGWIDFNNDGDLTDPGEMIISQAVTAGTAQYDFDIAAGTIDGTTQSFLSRFRIFTSEPAFAIFAYENLAVDGEVEDYLFTKSVGATIGDIVWIDTDGDGIFDSDEEGLGGVTVTLAGTSGAVMTTSDGSQDVDGDGIIDPVGYYAFTGLAAGNYSVTITNPSGYTNSYDKDTGTVSPDNTTGSFAVAADQQVLDADFGLQPATADISGTVYLDDVGDDNVFGAGDTPILGVIVQLWSDPNGDGDPSDGVQVGEVSTDSSGNYLFSDVPTGDYVVVEIDPTGATSDADTSGANDNRIPVAMSGTDSTGNDFLDDGIDLGSIAGTVYDDDDDTDNNTIGAEDRPLSGVTVELYQDLNGDGIYQAGEPLVATTATIADGSYSFTELPPGNYVIVETDLSGSVSDYDTDGSGTDNNIGVALASGGSSTGNNFLDDGPDSVTLGLGDRIFVDADGDNVFDAGEGVTGVSVELWASGEDPNGAGTPVATTTTGADGFYVFEGLAAGDYFVHVPKEEFQSGGDLEDKVSLGGATDDGTTDNDDNGIDARLPATTGISTRVYTLANGAEPTDDDDSGYSGSLSDDDVNLTADLGFQAAKPYTWPDFQDEYDTELDHTSSPGTNDQPGDNPDGDIWDNLKEYAFCLNPGSGLENHPGWCVELDVNGDLDIKFIRRLGGLSDVKYTVQGAATLGDPTSWTDLISIGYGSDLPGGVTATPTASGLGEEVAVTDIETYAPLTDSIGFTRIKIELDTDDDGNADVTTFTQVSGWQETTTFAQCETCSVPFLKKEAFSGGVVSLTAPDSLEVSASLASGQDLGAVLLTGGQFYVEVIAGDNEGQRWEVNEVASDADTIALNLSSMYNTSATVPATIAGDQIVVRKHWSLGEVVPLADVTKTDAPSTADKVLFYDSTGTFTSAVGSYEILWAMDFLSTEAWRSMDSGDNSDHSSRIIGPCEGFYIHRDTIGGTVKHVGLVRENKFCCPLVAGANLVPNPYPVDASTADWNMSVATGFTGSNNPSEADQIMLWEGDGVQGPQEFGGNFLMDWTIGETNYTWWAPIAGDSGLTNENESNVFKRNRSTFIKSISGKADFCVPPTWSP